jgi:hypothetical protein
MLILGSLLWRTTGLGQEPPPEPPPEEPVEQPRGRLLWLYEAPARTREAISRERSRFGITDALAAEAIAEVALRQVERGEEDEQKRFDELYRELELRSLEFDRRYLEALATIRGQLIEERRAFLQRQQEEDELIVLMLIAAATA